MDFLHAIAALSLGVVTSLHPCLALLNLGAFSIICSPFDQPVKMISGGIFFVLGRVVGYISIALLFIAGTTFSPLVAQLLRYYGNTLIGPLFIITGMIISGMFGPSKSAKVLIDIKPKSGVRYYLNLIFLGIIHAISFCPVSAGIFFGILLPASSESNSLIVNMLSYGVGTGLPLLMMLVMTAGGKKFISRYSEHQTLIEYWIKPISGAIVIFIGIFLTLDRVFHI